MACPGMAWEKQTPVFLPDLGKGSGFLRADGAIKVGINRGFAIPCSTLDGSNFVMAFLSALATPIARRVEIWEPDASGAKAAAHARFFGSRGASLETSAEMADAQATIQAPSAKRFLTGVPSVAEPMIAIPVRAARPHHSRDGAALLAPRSRHRGNSSIERRKPWHDSCGKT